MLSTFVTLGLTGAAVALGLWVIPWSEIWTGWYYIWIGLLGVVALPATIGVVMDGKGQAASGFVMMFGFAVSAILGSFYLLFLAVTFLISLIF